MKMLNRSFRLFISARRGVVTETTFLVGLHYTAALS